jgi:adenylate kinase
MSRRFNPNIIITGTPGCGKSSHAASLLSQLGEGFTHLPVSDLAKERDCIESYDKVLDTSVVDEDKLLDSLEIDLAKGGAIVDWHCCDIFPERLIDLVVVLRTDTALLHDRLQKRDYRNNKIQENIDCEIMDVILQDARDAYIPEIVIELPSNTADEMDDNVDRIRGWVENWVSDHPDGVTNELDPANVQPASDDESE